MSADDFGELLPADDDELTPEDDIAAAAAGALAEPDALAPDETDAPEPFGRTPAFDFENGRMVRQGGAPAWVEGFDALVQWCLMAAYSARYAHSIFSDEFGVESPNDVLGTVGPEAVERADDYLQRLREAWLVHDRVAVVDGDADYDPVAGEVVLSNLVVTTDEEVELPFPDLRFSVTEA